MSSHRPLFVTGPACSGSTLLAQMLSAHPALQVASDPYFPLFRRLRNSLVLQAPPEQAVVGFDPALPFQDYYYTAERLRIMDLVQAGDLNLPFEGGDWDDFYQASLARARHECPDLLSYFDNLQGATYKEIFDRGLDIIATARGQKHGYVGMKEVWVVECFAALARSYPEARFIILLRDPRAVLASLLAVSQRDPSQWAQPLSYARHCRKYFAFARQYARDPLFADRLHVLTFEDLARAPETISREVCAFLDLDYAPDMLDPGSYIDYSRGGAWQPNTAFDANVQGISAQEAERWREKLHPAAWKTMEFVCGPEMQLAGYELRTPPADLRLDPVVLDYLVKTADGDVSWRSDLEDIQLDYGCECFRWTLLDQKEDNLDPGLIRRSFLFTEVFTQLQNRIY